MICLGWFYGISIIVDHLMPIPLCTYILNMYMFCEHILKITFLNKPELFFSTQTAFKYCYITITI